VSDLLGGPDEGFDPVDPCDGLDENALLDACRAVVRRTLRHSPETPDTVEDIAHIIDTAQIERTVKTYFDLARRYATVLRCYDHDPNFVTRAVRYLGYECAPFMMPDDSRWFGNALMILFRLVSPAVAHSRDHIAFMTELESAARRYRREAQRDGIA
jgi:hypothetical protein